MKVHTIHTAEQGYRLFTEFLRNDPHIFERRCKLVFKRDDGQVFALKEGSLYSYAKDKIHFVDGTLKRVEQGFYTREESTLRLSYYGWRGILHSFVIQALNDPHRSGFKQIGGRT